YKPLLKYVAYALRTNAPRSQSGAKRGSAVRRSKKLKATIVRTTKYEKMELIIFSNTHLGISSI
ncbi:hypothetical protein, partial [Parasutterella excrementihominis]|uniref:hypothetical protein n=1 Tax=Parasutterella excrementihominis TaxID=487175 RepID=UPI0019D6A588